MCAACLREEVTVPVLQLYHTIITFTIQRQLRAHTQVSGDHVTSTMWECVPSTTSAMTPPPLCVPSTPPASGKPAFMLQMYFCSRKNKPLKHAFVKIYAEITIIQSLKYNIK